MSHDVDWRRQGPTYRHILERKDRFDQHVLEFARTQNPYYNIPQFMELEEKYGIRSTFFFRTFYEDGIYSDYEQDIKELIKGNWEIGLHLDPSSINDINKIKIEKESLERLTNRAVIGNRVHYLRFSKDLLRYLRDTGFRYDSTICNSKDNIENAGYGYHDFGGLLEFPLTLMDAFMFTYMRISEDRVVKIFEMALNHARKQNSCWNILTIIWHENVLRMRGGRMYPQILKFLSNQKDIQIVRGTDLIKIVGTLKYD
jgi:peptidoglycan/xylan/chitin deacetylase (PgdA/CDA1 family)